VFPWNGLTCPAYSEAYDALLCLQSAEWIDPSKTMTVLLKNNVNKKSDTAVEITLIPRTTKGKGTLTLISATQLRASSSVQVV
jgi:hypothetical protein